MLASLLTASARTIGNYKPHQIIFTHVLKLKTTATTNYTTCNNNNDNNHNNNNNNNNPDAVLY